MTAYDPDLLDQPDMLQSIDRSSMLRALATAGAQVRRAITATAESGLARLDPADRPRAVLIAAMGADDLVADLITTLAREQSPVGVSTVSDLPLPGWVGSLDLVLAVSLSGRAPGPVRLALEAGRRGAAVVTIGAPQSPLSDAAARARGVHIAVPTGGPVASLASRSAAWSMLTPALLAMTAHGILRVGESDLGDVADRLDAIAEDSRPRAESFVSQAKVLAAGLAESLPLVLADGPLTGVAARRAATMLARTSRIPVMSGQLPDAAAQVLACLDGPFAATPAAAGGRDIFADPYLDGPSGPETALVLIRDRDPRSRPEEAGGVRSGGAAPAYDEAAGVVPIEAQDAARINLAQGVADLAVARGTRLHELTPGPGSELTRVAELIATIDFATTYLALAHRLDPATAPAVADLRDLLR